MRQVTLRFDTTKITPRVEALLPHVQAVLEAHNVSASKVLLMALLEGLDVLEKRYKVKS
jgi:hypothetical protein